MVILKIRRGFCRVFCLSYFLQGAKDNDVMFLAFYICLYLDCLASIPLFLLIKFHTRTPPLHFYCSDSVVPALLTARFFIASVLHLPLCLYQTFLPCVSWWSSCSGSEGTVVRFSWSPIVLATAAVPGYMSNQLLLKNSDFAPASQAGACQVQESLKKYRCQTKWIWKILGSRVHCACPYISAGKLMLI